MVSSVDHRIDCLLQPVVQNFSNPSQPAWLGEHQVVAKSDNHKCYIIPPHISDKIRHYRLQLDSDEIRDIDEKHRKYSKAFRDDRKHNFILFAHSGGENGVEQYQQFMALSSAAAVIKAYDAHHKENLPGTFVAKNGANGTYVDEKNHKLGKIDEFAAKAIDNALTVFEFYLSNFKRNSIDGHNMPILSSVHYDQNYENAFWNDQQMVYGDGSEFFAPFVKFLDVVGHELTHGVTSKKLSYEGEAGALNESLSDVFGSLACQYKNKQTVEQADFLIGWSDEIGGIILDGTKTFPLRSMPNPGTAYDTPALGKDPQPANYHDRYTGNEDEGGVHINSGIPNRAFYIAAKEIGGFAWEKAGLVWYSTVQSLNLFKPTTSMAEFAEATLIVAKKLFTQDPKVSEAILKGWREVGVLDKK